MIPFSILSIEDEEEFMAAAIEHQRWLGRLTDTAYLILLASVIAAITIWLIIEFSGT